MGGSSSCELREEPAITGVDAHKLDAELTGAATADAGLVLVQGIGCRDEVKRVKPSAQGADAVQERPMAERMLGWNDDFEWTRDGEPEDYDALAQIVIDACTPIGRRGVQTTARRGRRQPRSAHGARGGVDYFTLR